MNLLDLLEELGVPKKHVGEHHHATPGRVQVDCPMCSPGSGRFRLGISTSYLYCSCWACGRLNLWEVLQELTGWDWGKVKDTAGKLEKHELPKLVLHKKLVLPQGLGDLEEAHVRYLRERGFEPKELEKLWEVKGIGKHGRPPWRIFIPIHYRGKLVSWTSRYLSPNISARYKTAAPEEEALRAKDLLYGEDYARNSLIVLEGPTKVWRVGPGSVCTLGVSFTREQVRKISKYPVRAVCFDGDEEGRKKAKELCEMLEPFPGRTYDVVLESHDDPADASEKEIKKLRERFLT